MEIRNIAIIAHVDHGKTTLTDALMRLTGMIEEGVTMDSNALEQERGITIYSKNASLLFRGTKINIVDTPGHADFSSEVERVLRSIDDVVLVVDAQEGPMPQTKFVLKKSLELGFKPIVVINKIDKPAARPEEVHELVLELFMDLGANDKQINFPTVYTDGKKAIAKLKLTDTSSDLVPLLETILAHVPPAEADTSLPLRIQPFNLAYDNFLGRLALGRVYEGTVKAGENVIVKKSDGATRPGKITRLFTFRGLQRVEVPEAQAGDIVLIAGLPDIYIGETICQKEDQEPLPAITVDEPTIALNFLVNNSPFAGREGKFVTTRQIRERLEKELEVNVGLKVDFSSPDSFQVCGRGELHIAILLENMRREGFELQVSQPRVITKEEGGKILEPFEEVTIDVPEGMEGIVIEHMGKRRGAMIEMKHKHGHVRLVFSVPTRGLLGYRNQFIVDTRGEGILASRFTHFGPMAGEIERRDFGSMVSMAGGSAVAYALDNLQERGVLYIDPGDEIYEGMIIGSVTRGNDMAVNPIKGKHLSNVRSVGEDTIQLKAPFRLSLERGLELIGEDEFLEITPKMVRLRKQLLTDVQRVRAARNAKK
jgi:GTP-binding protein